MNEISLINQHSLPCRDLFFFFFVFMRTVQRQLLCYGSLSYVKYCEIAVMFCQSISPFSSASGRLFVVIAVFFFISFTLPSLYHRFVYIEVLRPSQPNAERGQFT